MMQTQVLLDFMKIYLTRVAQWLSTDSPELEVLCVAASSHLELSACPRLPPTSRLGGTMTIFRVVLAVVADPVTYCK